MYSTLIIFHSVVRWLVVISLIYAIFKAYHGYRNNRKFSNTDNLLRHWTATFAHIQLIIGMVLYIQSPIIKVFWKSTREAIHNLDSTFYSLIHSLMMITGVVVLTMGSAISKRKPTDKEKFRIMFIWFLTAFIIFLIAIPWPFSFLSQRPYIRFF